MFGPPATARTFNLFQLQRKHLAFNPFTLPIRPDLSPSTMSRGQVGSAGLRGQGVWNWRLFFVERGRRRTGNI